MANVDNRPATAHPGLDVNPFPVVIHYGGMGFQITGEEAAGDKPGDPNIFRLSLDGFTKDDPTVAATVSAVQDLYNQFLENQAVKVEVARLTKEEAGQPVPETELEKTARANVKKTQADKAAASKPAAKTAPAPAKTV